MQFNAYRPLRLRKFPFVLSRLVGQVCSTVRFSVETLHAGLVSTCIGNREQQSRAPGTRVSLRTSPSKEGTRRHFLNKKILWTSFLDPSFLSPWGGRKLWPPFGANFETRRKLQSQQTRQLEREDERAEAQLFSGRFDINLVALWVGKERALKPFLQLFITLDQKVCLIPELRFPIPTLLNKKKVIFLPPVDFFLKKKHF